MIGSESHAGGDKKAVSPFLLRFAKDCVDVGEIDPDKQPPPRTSITRVDRETSDDR